MRIPETPLAAPGRAQRVMPPPVDENPFASLLVKAGNLVEQWQDQRDHDLLVEKQNAYTRSMGEWKTKTETERQGNGAAGISKEYQTEHERLVADLLKDSGMSGRAQKAFRVWGMGRETHGLESMVRYEHRQMQLHGQDMHNLRVQGIAEGLENNPDGYADAFQQLEESYALAVGQGIYRPEEAKLRFNDTKDKLRGTAFDNLYAVNRGRAMAAMGDMGLSRAEQARAQKRYQADLRADAAHARAAKAEDRERLKDRERDLSAAFKVGEGVAPALIPTEKEYVKAFGPEDGPKRHAALMEAQALGLEMRGLAQMTPEQQLQMVTGEIAPVTGQIAPGNISLRDRPRVKNDDHSVSTVRSASYNIDGQEVLLPTVSDDGRTLSDDEAVAAYRKSGKHLGIFETPESADAYAESLHRQQARTLRGYYAEPGTEGYADAQARQGVLAEAVARDATLRAADPALYVLRADAAARNALEKLSAPEATAEDAERYALAVKAGYEARGMKADAPILPREMLRNMGNAFTAAVPQDAAGMIMQQKALWGRHWPQVYGQLVTDKDVKLPTAAYAIGAGMDAEPAVLLTQAAQTPDFEKSVKALNADAVKEFDESLPGSFAPLGLSLRRQGGLEQEKLLYDQARKLGLQYVLRGLSGKDAAAKAAEEIGAKRYTIQNGYRVPRFYEGQPLNADLVAAGTREFLRQNLDKTDLFLPDIGRPWMRPEEIDELTRKAIRQNAEWVTDENENGLVLYRGPFAVLTQDGLPVRLSWEELNRLGANTGAVPQSVQNMGKRGGAL